MNLLGVDWGERKVGLEVAEDGWVEPWEVIPRIGVIGKIRGICQEKKIGKIILGLPEGRLAEPVKKFSQELRKKTDLPVDLVAETLTSQDALARMKEAGKKQQARRQEDAFAAALVLEDYLARPKEDD